jgi:hypothetical protein
MVVCLLCAVFRKVAALNKKPASVFPVYFCYNFVLHISFYVKLRL